MHLEVWHELTLSLGSAFAVLGFFRSLEQRKDTEFNELIARLCDSGSAVARAAAARQLPSFFKYRSFSLSRPYRELALELACNGLKVPTEVHFVRQALADSLRVMLGALGPRKWGSVRLIDARLDRLILHDFPFDEVDLTEANLEHSDLGNASFVGAKLWRAKLCHAKLTSANFDGAKIWDTDFSHANLEGARIDTQETNEHTRFDHANLQGVVASEKVKECRGFRP
jgi:hypothetical protein